MGNLTKQCPRTYWVPLPVRSLNRPRVSTRILHRSLQLSKNDQCKIHTAYKTHKHRVNIIYSDLFSHFREKKTLPVERAGVGRESEPKSMIPENRGTFSFSVD